MKKKMPAVPQQSGDIPEWAWPAVQSILASLKAVDEQTYLHCLRVGNYASKLAKAAGLTEYQQKVAEFSGMLHDVGKMGVDKGIINKPARLTQEEHKTMMTHPVLSEVIVQPLASIQLFQEILPAIRGHHERLDGLGYPDNLSGDQIPLLARVILIVDTLDAMSANRAYRNGLSIDIIYRELEKFAGTQFDKSLVKIFLDSHRFWSKEGLDPQVVDKIIKKVA